MTAANMVPACFLDGPENSVFTFADLQKLPHADSFLTAEEQSFLKLIRIDKRKLEWQGGRLAAKRIMSRETGKSMTALHVEYDAFHRPICGGRLISITHSNGIAAAAYAGGRLVGADLEKIKPHSAAWQKHSFFEEEIPGHTDYEAIRAWTLKEALLKALGIGLTVPLKSINISALASGGLPVFTGKALERFESLGKPCLITKTSKIGELCFSIAVEAQYA